MEKAYSRDIGAKVGSQGAAVGRSTSDQKLQI